MSLRVLMVNRSDAYRSIGGDTIQMERTAESLRRIGVDVACKLVHEVSDRELDVDLVHLFNIQLPEEIQPVCERVLKRGLPYVLSPIYWDPLPGWFWDDRNLQPVWLGIRKALGYRIGLELYSGWQRRRFHLAPSWSIQRQLLQLATVLLPNSSAEAVILRQNFRLAQDASIRSAVIPNAIDRAQFDRDLQPSSDWQERIGSREFVLQVGRISIEKNCASLIRALWNDDVQIAFVGRPSPHYPEYAEMCHKLATRRGKVQFLDWVPAQELPSLYATASAHVLPSWRETPGLASLEAGASGCPVVSTTIGSAHEYFGADAWYCSPDRSSTIRMATLDAMKSPRQESLRQKILDSFTWDVAASRTLAAYERALDGKEPESLPLSG